MADPFDTLKLLQSHLESRMRQGQTRLWMTAEATRSLREIVRSKPRPRPHPTAPAPAPAPAQHPASLPVIADPDGLSGDKEESTNSSPVTTVETWRTPPGSQQERMNSWKAWVSSISGGSHNEATPPSGSGAGKGPLDAVIAFVSESDRGDGEESNSASGFSAGPLLEKVLKAMGLSREKVYWTCSNKPAAVMRPREGVAEEGDGCGAQALHHILRREIEIVSPKVVVALGPDAARVLIGPEAPAGLLRGCFKLSDGTPVVATPDPESLVEAEAAGAPGGLASKRSFWEDMLKAMELAGLPVTEKQRGYFLMR